MPHCGFDLHFSVSNIEQCTYWPSICLLWRNVYLGLLKVGTGLTPSPEGTMTSQESEPCGSWDFCLPQLQGLPPEGGSVCPQEALSGGDWVSVLALLLLASCVTLG